MEDGLKLYANFTREYPTGVFIITRDCDAKCFMYIAQRHLNTLVGEKVKCVAMIAPNWHKEESIHEVVLNSFFKLHVTSIEGTSKHEARMAAFPERSMILHLKKNSAESKNDGHVTATGTFVLGSGKATAANSVHNVQLLSMHQIVIFDEMEIPDIRRVHLFGCVNKENVQHIDATLLANYCKPYTETQLLIEEVVEITDEMRKRFDIKSLATQWFLSKAKLA